MTAHNNSRYSPRLRQSPANALLFFVPYRFRTHKKRADHPLFPVRFTGHPSDALFAVPSMSPAAAVAAMKTVPILPGMRMTPSCSMTMAVTIPCTMTVTATATAPTMRMPVREPAFPAGGARPLFQGQRELFQQTRQLHLLLTGKPFQQLPGFLTTVPADEIRQLAPLFRPEKPSPNVCRPR